MAATTAVALDIIAGMQRVLQGPQDRELSLPILTTGVPLMCSAESGFRIDPPQVPNRGNKLKRKDHPIGDGSMTGQRPYKKVWLQHGSSRMTQLCD